MNQWPRIDSESALQEAVLKSNDGYVAIFKHSTRCGISSAALRRLETANVDQSKVQIFYLDVIGSRPVSNAVADHFGVRHESPQLLLLRDGKCVFNASHENIDPDEIRALATSATA